MIETKAHRQQVNLMSHHGLNKAAMRLLPEAMRSRAEMPVLLLMHWALLDGRLVINRASPEHPGREELEQAVLRLMQMPPPKAMEYLTQLDNGFLLTPDALNQVKSPQEGARLLLESLQEKMVEMHA